MCGSINIIVYSRLVLSTHDCTRSILDRYVEDLSLPEYISTEIIRPGFKLFLIFSAVDQSLSIFCSIYIFIIVPNLELKSVGSQIIFRVNHKEK